MHLAYLLLPLNNIQSLLYKTFMALNLILIPWECSRAFLKQLTSINLLYLTFANSLFLQLCIKPGSCKLNSLKTKIHLPTLTPLNKFLPILLRYYIPCPPATHVISILISTPTLITEIATSKREGFTPTL
jgi:hypothetical protein